MDRRGRLSYQGAMNISPPRAGLYKRFFAWLMAHHSDGYERQMAVRKRELLSSLSGDVVEIGPGTGPNLAHFAEGVRWVGFEPNPYMHAYLHREAENRGLAVDMRYTAAERLDLPDASADAVVSTFVLCSVDDLAAALQQILRVLRPGGRFVFIEHVAAPRGTRLRRWQDRIEPLWRVIGDGCRPNRETWAAIEQAGFADVRYEHFGVKLSVPFEAPHIAGVAVKGAA
jgi:ubiquinone/menaquinone biosynthesis C-methylase UbiE